MANRSMYTVQCMHQRQERRDASNSTKSDGMNKRLSVAED